MGKILAITWKDALAELRTREIVFSVLVFTILVLVIFNFAFGANPELIAPMAPGVLWITFAFAGVLSLNRAFVAEKEEGCIEGLMVSPISRETIYAGKMLGSLLFMLIVEAVSLPVFTLLFNLPVFSPELAVLTLLATIGFVAVGTLFSALAVNTRAREMVLPVLFLPIIVPVIIAAVQGSDLALTGKSWADLLPSFGLIGAFDAVFLVVAPLVFGATIEE